MLIEKDYRGTETTLAYNGMLFSVPENMYIIGMMNTADRSLAMIDYALRRRFSFYTMAPGFDSDGFKNYQKELDNNKLDRLVAEVINLNKAITNDKSLGSGFCIGHSYFCGHKAGEDDRWIKEVVEYDGCVYNGVDEYHRDDSLIVYCREKRIPREYHGDLMFVFIYDCVELDVVTKAAVNIYREYKPELIDKYLGNKLEIRR